MALRVAIVGIDPLQRDWLRAVSSMRAAGEIDVVAAGHRTVALARDLADALKADQAPQGGPPAYDDLRLLLNETAPQIVVLDRTPNMPLELLLTCIRQHIGILSVGPPVETVAEAQALAEVLEPRTHLLRVWPRMADTFGYRQPVGADDFIRPVRFASGTWMAMNHALAKAHGPPPAATVAEPSGGCAVVRSLSVLAWDALGTLIELIDVPTTVYASIRGTVGLGDTFSDISGSAGIVLRFPEDAVAALTLSDRVPGAVMPGGQRTLLLSSQTGSARLTPEAYAFHDQDGRLVDEGILGAATADGAGDGGAAATLCEFLSHFTMPASAGRGWEHRLESVAATIEAVIVSQRTGQPESPERFWRLRR